MTRLVFVDVETTGLVPGFHEVWEVALVVRKERGDDRHVFHLKPAHLERADPAALRINRFYERTEALRSTATPPGVIGDPMPGQQWADKPTAARRIAQLTAGATLVGLNVQFDERFTAGFLRGHGHAPSWHYHLLELRSAAWGHLTGRGGVQNLSIGSPSADLSAACGVGAPAPDIAHDALVDAIWARDWFDAIAAGGAR